MSASNKKKLRKQEAEAKMTERQQAASKEAKKQKNLTLTFCVVMVLCLCITAGALLANPAKNIVYRNANVVEVGEHELTAVELNYFYVDAINQFYSQYQSYISYLLNTKAPLNQQVYNQETGETWADYFVSMAYNNIKSTYAVYDLAMSKGFTLPEDYKTALDNKMMYNTLYASLYSNGNVDKYLATTYGNGATEESYRSYYEKCLIAEAYYVEYGEGLEYNLEQLTAYQQSEPHVYNSYTFATYYLAANTFYAEDAGTKDDKGKVTYSDEEKAAAIAACKEAAEKLAAGEYATLEDFDKAINEFMTSLEAKPETDKPETDKPEDETDKGEERTGENTDGDDTTEGDDTTDKEEDKEDKLKYESVKNEDVNYNALNALFKDWIIGKVGVNEDGEATIVVRKEGDLTIIENASGTGDNKTVNGYYVIRFGSINDNEFAMKNVRHLLVKFVKLGADGKPTTNSSSSSSSSSTPTYTEAEKKYAKDEAEKLLKQWQEGAATEDTFAELANKESDDGDGTTGGLYENIYPGQMVEEFEDWCYDEARKAGDVEIIETEYGYHIMYFVGNTELTYRQYMVQEALRAEDVEKWYTALVEAVSFKALTDKYVNKEITMG